MCDILSAISYGLYPQHHQHIQQHYHPERLRPFKKFKVNMTIPSRPAPPPPQALANRTANRYSPATNWDDTPFGSSAAAAPQVKKAPPPRPPPPKVVPALKKPGQAQSINILSNLFGQKRGGSTTKPPVSQKPVLMKLPPPPKLPPPNGGGYGSFGHGVPPPTTTNPSTTSELISFDSPPSSPTFTQKSCSDCISVDSFSSDSNYSSPNNGNMSQAESGFEDDFVVTTEHGRRSKVTTPSAPTSSSRDLWDLSDPFGMPPSAAAAGTGTSSSNSSHYAPVGSATIRVPTVNSKLYETEFVDPLCNGKTVAPKVQTIAKPTIIKTVTTASASSSQKSTPVHHQQQHHLELKPKPVLTPPVWSIKPPAPAPIPPASFVDAAEEEDEESSSLDSLPSLPMPNIPPPPPPVVVGDDVIVVGSVPEEGHREPYGIAMYDFNGETDEDLSFRTNDKIYLLKRLNEEWLLGRDRRGCEGMFPANYIEVRIALPGDNHHHRQPQTTTISSSSKYVSPVASSFNPPKVRVLYTFNAETAEDLTIVENDFVTVLHQITPEWLFGECRGQRGQFPANFIEYVPPNLPLVPPPAN
uniref:Putative crk family adapter n=1 Tax=Culex tarsalis TaxID=7177 RepID=A0A1Q3G353_CULTA